MDLFTFDFSSCGNGDGEWVTMGLKEKEDLKTVVDWLERDQSVSGIVIWGRSMGAATTIMAMPEIKSSKLKGAVLDSPFKSLESFKDNLIKLIFESISEEEKQELSTKVKHKISTTCGFDLD